MYVLTNLLFLDITKKSSKVPIYTSQGRDWQECPNRNWAAEFGYGGGQTSIGVTRDILSKMAMSFKDDEDEKKATPGYDSGVGLDDEGKMFQARGFKGTVKASLNRAPRTLSTSSLRTRKRMEALMRRARDFMKKAGAKKTKILSNHEGTQASSTKNNTAPEPNKDNDDRGMNKELEITTKPSETADSNKQDPKPTVSSFLLVTILDFILLNQIESLKS